MIKLMRYLKKYSLYLIIAVFLLFCQAVMELALPSLMSDIVNVGIQNGGVEEYSPKAISKEAYDFLFALMSDEQKEFMLTSKSYTPFAELSGAEQDKILKKYPLAEQENAMIFSATSQDKAKTDEAFEFSMRCLISLLGAVEEMTGQDFSIGEGTDSSVSFDVDAIENIDFSFVSPQLIAEIQAKEGSGEETMAGLMAGGMLPMLNKSIYKGLGAETDKIQTGYIMRTGGKMLVLSLLLCICAVLATFGFARMGTGVARDLRRDVFGKVMSFSSADMDSYSASSLITRSTNDIMQVQMMYTMALRMMVFAPVMGIGGVIMASRKSSGMSWLIAVAVGVLMAIMLVFYFTVVPKFKKMQKLVDRLNLVSRENLNGMLVIRAFGTEDFQQERFEEANGNYTKNNLFVSRATALMMPLISLLMNVLCLLIVWLGADQVRQMQMQVGDIMAYIQYAMHIVMSFMFIAMIFVFVPRASVSAGRINEVLNKKNNVQDEKTPDTLGGQSKGIINFNNVSFKYPGADECVLKNINFKAEPGKTTAFIGSTGSGKSTLINLIPRFYDVSEGEITLDGTDVRKLTQEELRQNVAYVPQKGLLFSGDIAENLRYGKADASEEELEKALEIAQAADFVAQKEDGLESDVSQGGSNFSGGQRQRLSIARAVVKNAPVYIFDDSFSALDFATDSRLRKALEPHTQNSTVLIVAQRISTIMYAEQIIVLDHGEIVGKGRHEELLKSCETYREIAESQLSEKELEAAHKNNAETKAERQGE